MNQAHSHFEALTLFKIAMQNSGIDTDAIIHGDGKIHRFDVTGDKPGSKNGWYVLHFDSVPAGHFGCWKRDISSGWCAKTKAQMTAAERKEHSIRLKEMAHARELELQAVRKACQAKAKTLWNNARDNVDSNHPYLVRKGVKAHGLRQQGEAITIPLRSACVAMHFMASHVSSRGSAGMNECGCPSRPQSPL